MSATDPDDKSMALPADTPPTPEARVGDVPPPGGAPKSAGDRISAVASSARAAVGNVGSGSGSGSGSIAASLPVGSELAQEKPEVLVAGAFAAAFIFARILKHITSE